ncbi:ISL3 family transposase [Thiolapillus sp.]|uniref:ISL3 family transposase n=2 Tax=Thiolapillus sp. TaxID=2017437 RepID=UPI003AF9458B
MGIGIPSKILNLPGQRVNQIDWQPDDQKLVIQCRRDRRRKVVDPVTGKKGTINKYVKRQIRDVPLCGYRCMIEIELAQVWISKNERRVEYCKFVDKGSRFTHRFCHLVSGLCRHLSIQAVARHLGLRWETVKNIDKAYLHKTLPALDPSSLTGLKYIGVDEVARAKGHDYMTVVYDMEAGHLIWVGTGRTANVFSGFLQQLPKATAAAIEAVAMDMGPSYQKAVAQCLPKADIVFDRFHVMQNYSKAIQNQRRIEFRKANKPEKELMKGTHYLLLKNPDKLNEKQATKLQTLLDNNAHLNTLYVLKEQLQLLWDAPTYDDMTAQLEQWCQIADQSQMLYLKKFAQSLRRHCTGICNYAKHKLTSARIEAGNVSIGMIRKRARGIQDTEYFKLKIRQSSLPDDKSMFYGIAGYSLT